MRLSLKTSWMRLLPWLVLMASLLITFQLWRNAQQQSMHDLQSNFNYRVLEALHRLDERILSYEQVPVGVQALFAASDQAGRDEFRLYVNALQLGHQFSGIHGVTLVMLVPSLDKSPAVYIEQFPGRNKQAFGYDVFSRPEQSATMEHALNTGQPAVTGKLIMAPGSDGRRQSAFLMYMPIYKKGGAYNTLAERHANVVGWVAVTIRMHDLMLGILGDSAADLGMEIFDGEEMSEMTLLYDTDSSHAGRVQESVWFKTVKHIEVSGHTWTLAISSLPDFEARLDKTRVQLIVSTGIGISILLGLLTGLLVRGRARALQAVREIGEVEAKLHAILDNSPIGIWLVGMDGRYRFVNKKFCDALGLTEQQFLGRRPSEILGEEASASLMRSDRECMQHGMPCTSHEKLVFADGKEHLLEITKLRLSDKEGMASGFISIMTDITEASALQDALKKSRDELEMRVGERTQNLTATAFKLEREIQTRKKLERNILEISEEEQARIGRELHDDLGQLLTGVAYLAGALSSRLSKVDMESSQQAGEIKKIAQDAIKRTRYISHGLVPFSISSQGLKQGLEQLANDVSRLSGIHCEMHFSGNVEISDFMVATHLYRIAQEIINNAVKHSSANELFMELSTNANEIRLIIADNGVGMPANLQEMDRGLGLMNMKYRAQIIGATIVMDALEGRGTRVTLTLPLV